MSNDFGVTWSQLTGIPGTADINGLAVSDSGQYMYAVEFNGNIWVSTDSASLS